MARAVVSVGAGSEGRLWSALSGLVCIHKPSGLAMAAVKKLMARRICEDANAVVQRKKLATIQMPIVEPHPKTGALLVVGQREQVDYMRHPLVVGDPFRMEDLKIEELHQSEATTSGIAILGINDGCDLFDAIRQRCWIDGYKVDAQFGRQTYEHEIRGKLVREAKYDHITRYRISKLLAKILAQFQKTAYSYAEVDLDSQEAFEIARKGLPRSKIPGSSLIYDLRLNYYKKETPYFSLQIQASGAPDLFFRAFVQEFSLGLGTVGSPRRLYRYRIGPFGLENGLLMKHFTLQNILDNMVMCRNILEQTESVSDNVISKLPEKKQTDIRLDELVELVPDFDDGKERKKTRKDEEEEDCLRVPFGRKY